jgi:D-alanyl-D-alanine carboxypeptidase
VVDAQTGEIYFARNPNLQLPPASTTKLLTALIALHETAPEDVLPVSPYASSMPASKAYLRPGWTMQSRDLLYALLLHSSNDAAVVLAEGVGGSVAGFARIMNTTARSFGATQSNFVTPNGLPAADHYSTARDMALIMRQVLQTPGMRDLLSTRATIIQPYSGSRKRIPLRSTNKLLWRDDLHVIGKTGYTRLAKRCFVGAASAGGREVIVAVLGSTNLWGDVELLSAYGLDQVAPDWRQQTGYQVAAAPRFGSPGSAGTRNRFAVPPAELVPPQNRLRGRAQAPAADARRYARAGVAAPGEGDREDISRAGLRYHLQLGSYPTKARADQVRQQAAKRGYRAVIQKVSGSFRVTVRDFTSRDTARQAAQSLKRSLRIEPIIVASR